MAPDNDTGRVSDASSAGAPRQPSPDNDTGKVLPADHSGPKVDAYDVVDTRAPDNGKAPAPFQVGYTYLTQGGDESVSIVGTSPSNADDGQMCLDGEIVRSPNPKRLGQRMQWHPDGRLWNGTGGNAANLAATGNDGCAVHGSAHPCEECAEDPSRIDASDLQIDPTQHSVVVGAEYRYECRGSYIEGYTQHSGCTVKVVSGPRPDPFTYESMYSVQAEDGWTGSAFEGELHPLDGTDVVGDQSPSDMDHGNGMRITSGPSELEMHRADYNAVREAGFHDPGELLAAYKHLARQENEARRKLDDLVAELTRRDQAAVAQGSPACRWCRSSSRRQVVQVVQVQRTFVRGETYLHRDGRKGVFIASHPHDGALLVFNEVDRPNDEIMEFFACEAADVVGRAWHDAIDLMRAAFDHQPPVDAPAAFQPSVYR